MNIKISWEWRAVQYKLFDIHLVRMSCDVENRIQIQR